MSTPEEKFQAAASKVSAELAKVKSLWQRWEVYVIGVLCFAAGWFVRAHL